MWAINGPVGRNGLKKIYKKGCINIEAFFNTNGKKESWLMGRGIISRISYMITSFSGIEKCNSLQKSTDILAQTSFFSFCSCHVAFPSA